MGGLLAVTLPAVMTQGCSSSRGDSQTESCELLRALEVRCDLVCTDAPECRLTVERLQRDPLEVSMSVYFPRRCRPFKQLESILHGQG